MITGTRQKLSQIINEPVLSIGSESVSRVSSTKTLGVIVDERITWRDQIDQVAKKASKGIGLLRRSKHLVNGTTLKTIYDALVLPHFDYCALVWDNCSKSLQNKLVKLQNKAARILTDDSYETPSEAVRAKLNWETSQSRREKIIFLFMKETINGNSNKNIGDLFRISCNTSHNLGSNNNSLKLRHGS